MDTSGPRSVSPIGGLPAAIYSPLEGRCLDGLPEPRTGVVYVTSILCLSTARAMGRLDVCAPDTDTGAVRAPVAIVDGRRTGGELLGTTRLLLAGDEPPAYRLLTGSATHGSGMPRDLDVLGYGPAREALASLRPIASMPLVCVHWPLSNGTSSYISERRAGTTPRSGASSAWMPMR